MKAEQKGSRRTKSVAGLEFMFSKMPDVRPTVKLKEVEQKYRSLFATNMIGIVLSDQEDKIIEANDAFLNIVGFTRADLKNGVLTWSRITPKQYDALDQKKMREIMRRGTIVPFEKAYIHKKGHHVPVLVGAETINTEPALNISFALDISEQKKIAERKDDFISMVSHELKNPLAVMKIYAELMLKNLSKTDVKEMRENALEIYHQIERINQLVSDLANLAQIERNAKKAGKDILDLREIIKDVSSKTILTHRRKVELKGTGAPLLIQGNSSRLWQVFNNLVGNAVKYSSPEKKIVVSMKKEGRHAFIMVRDYGIGISKKEVQAIFKRYYRVKHASSYQAEGIGVGLYISREIVKAHKGAITVESLPGKGSTFTCRLPLAFPKHKVAV